MKRKEKEVVGKKITIKKETRENYEKKFYKLV